MTHHDLPVQNVNPSFLWLGCTWLTWSIKIELELFLGGNHSTPLILRLRAGELYLDLFWSPHGDSQEHETLTPSWSQGVLSGGSYNVLQNTPSFCFLCYSFLRTTLGYDNGEQPWKTQKNHLLLTILEQEEEAIISIIIFEEKPRFVFPTTPVVCPPKGDWFAIWRIGSPFHSNSRDKKNWTFLFWTIFFRSNNPFCLPRTAKVYQGDDGSKCLFF